MQSYTNIQKAQEQAINGASKEMGQDAFLLLMMEQLKYQDPLAPVGNTEFLAQQAAFTQVSAVPLLHADGHGCMFLYGHVLLRHGCERCGHARAFQ